MSAMGLVSLVLVGVAVFFGAKLAMKKFEEIQARRVGAYQLAMKLQVYGLKKVPDILVSYASGNYSKAAHQCADLVRILNSGEDVVMKELNDAFKNILASKLSTEEGRAFVQVATDEAFAKAKAS
jgi:hypothetical protein